MPRKLSTGFQATCLLTPKYQFSMGKRELTKHFSLNKFGGEKEARAAAEEQEKIWRRLYGTKRRYKTKPLSNNKSSRLPGICITSSYDKRREKRYYYANASWVDRNGKAKCTGYSIHKWGKDGAIYLAIKKRLEGIHGKRYVKDLLENSSLYIPEGSSVIVKVRQKLFE